MENFEFPLIPTSAVEVYSLFHPLVMAPTLVNSIICSFFFFLKTDLCGTVLELKILNIRALLLTHPYQSSKLTTSKVNPPVRACIPCRHGLFSPYNHYKFSRSHSS